MLELVRAKAFVPAHQRESSCREELVKEEKKDMDGVECKGKNLNIHFFKCHIWTELDRFDLEYQAIWTTEGN